MASAAAASGRGAQTINSFYFKPMLRKAYHKKGSAPEEVKNKNMVNTTPTTSSTNSDGNYWVRDERTGIFYPKGQEKAIEDIPIGACKELGRIHWFATHEASD